MTGLWRIAGCASFLGLPLLLASTNACVGTAQVRQIFMALDGSGARVRDQFVTDTTQIFCDVAFAGADPDTTVVATFEQLTGEPSLFDGSGNTTKQLAYDWGSVEVVPQTGESLLTFALSPPTPVNGGAAYPFPVGNWKCLISVNGQNAGDTSFTVNYPNPDCPPSGAASVGDNCTAYQLNAQCPSSGNFSDSTACTCTANLPSQFAESGLRSWSCTE
jgi:hypothetical protein